ncbi:MAG: DNA topoisomerase I [Nitrososphaerales archaeon]
MLGIKNYILTICEKPDAARKIARAIGIDDFKEVWIDGLQLFISRMQGRTFVVCYALGHLYTLEDSCGNRHVYPVFEVKWVPVGKKFRIKRIIEVITKISKDASDYVNACDFDQEGEVIGYNILRYACGNKHENAYRAKFSTLTEEELRSAFLNMKRGSGAGLANAGRARHKLDFLYGVNLSRALSESVYRSSKRFRNLSIGRVQGPTLSFVVEREIEIRTHIPIPYWNLTAKFEKDGQAFSCSYEKEKVMKLAEAKVIVSACKDKDGKVSDIMRERTRQEPPVPFNLGDLQREAYRLFRFNPSFTLSIAERLYLDALISYPRTSSQKLKSIDYRKIIRNLGSIGVYANLSGNLLKEELIPHEGIKDDPAHPAIHPTGEVPKRKLESAEWRLYDLIVKRFFATFAKAAIREKTDAVIDVNGYKFVAKGRTTIEAGWTVYYMPYADLADIKLPLLNVNDAVRNLGIKNIERQTQPPPRFNQASLVEKMEREEIGTKATRAEIVRTLVKRGYITGESIEATELGFAVIEIMQRYMPDIISVQLTRTMENELQHIELNRVDDGRVVDNAIKLLKASLEKFRSKENEVGEEMNDVIAKTIFAEKKVGQCPLCKDGVLRIIRSKQSGKRFVGCSNYEKSCRASMPLPQSGIIRTTSKSCEICNWPVVLVKAKSRPLWKMCVNIRCPTKGKKSDHKV